ncbi:sulfite exporter TauE/SafE family protein [Kamptonema cortianum]|uniref:Probable membrane transporter protein n=1 Tax=Geitlerinema calcuttense NRMC-F 0142 TaxID=2922238 RepID=A0ABT7LVR8_9CYAN|nr:sulfite exporter TauE/SafE family protein [Geitlerinema calcuttense]MDI9638366.1 sulfite exporter TauE/SafE family protein [Geitlerinema splendidum]MDK3155791.1 sulfite exporter TauE/SafE family protein [Kamptonema cortianum]MDL5045641.1 sulfite exporter TauE/SafE family protein [Oscillatoria amoena NRMC-F 0135]MDL5056124.1 sulfite exporter TauE/SafE family protein [Geitlerinema calcuttense NRMC-F 0142]
MHYLSLSALSFLVGIVVGLTGIGGASLITPMLIFGFQVPVSVAVSSDVVAATLMKIVGSAKHWRQQTIDLQAVTWLVSGSVPGSLLGVSLLHWIQQIETLNLDRILLRLLGVAILAIASIALVQLLVMSATPSFQFPLPPKLNLKTLTGRIIAVCIGAILGCIVGMTSVSSGSMFAIVLVTLFQLDAQKLVGTDLTQAAILLSVTSLGHFTLGTVDWNLVIPIWIGSVPGVLLGAKLCQIAPQKILRFAVYLMLVMVSWRLAHFT